MATTVVTPTALSYNTAQVVTAGSGTAIDATKNMTIAYPKEGKLFLIIQSSHANTALTFTASDHFVAAGKGDLLVAVANGVSKALMVESDRFKQANGSLNITFHADSTGFVQAYYTV